MRTYGMAYQQVMSMPMRAFWTVSGFVPRILADESMVQLEVNAAAHDAGAAEQLMEQLRKKAPDPVKFTGHALASVGAEKDSEGIDSLRSLAG